MFLSLILYYETLLFNQFLIAENVEILQRYINKIKSSWDAIQKYERLCILNGGMGGDFLYVEGSGYVIHEIQKQTCISCQS